MSKVLLENVTKRYDDSFTAVDNVNLEITDGEFMVIIGPSGCGKTTILRMIAGLENISKGTITIGSKIVNDMQPKDRDVAMVFQNYALYPHMTVYNNIAFPLKLRKHPKDEIKNRVEEVALLLGIQDFLKRKPGTLSGGQRQRVALGRAIARRPKVFLFDEPLSNIDPQTRLRMRKELKILHEKLKITCIYVTHDHQEAVYLGNRICVLYDGVIQQVDKVNEICNNPVNENVAGFFNLSYLEIG